MVDGFTAKLKRVYAYLFSEYAFEDVAFDYTKYWDQLSKDEEHPASQYKLKLVESVVDVGSSVLDMGCGDGTLLVSSDQVKKDPRVWVGAIGYRRGTREKKGLTVRQVNLGDENLEVKDNYDYIISSEVIEHLPKPEDLIKQVKGKFNKYLIISVPNTGFLGERLRLLFGKAPKQWVYHPSEHVRFWTVSDFLFWVEQLGLKVDRYYGLLDEYYDIRIPLWRWFPRLFSRYILYLIKEKD